MAPLKEKIDYKYKVASYSIYKLLKDEDVDNIDIEGISQFKGMINRVIRQDQWDWFTVYTRFGEPEVSSLRGIPQQLTLLRKAIINKDTNEKDKILNKLVQYNVIGLCEFYLDRKSDSSKEDHGYIYILSRREEKDILKIGMTNRDVETRVKEINSATGVLYPLSARKIFKVKDAIFAEKEIFKALDDFRIRADREFFEMEFYKAEEIIKKVLKENNLLF